jgi:acetyltransferase
MRREMTTGIRGYPILEGLRGQQGMSIDLLTDYIERPGRVVADFSAINEIDLNPVKGFGTKANKYLKQLCPDKTIW